MPTKREREYYRMGFRDGSIPRYPDDPDSPMGRMVLQDQAAISLDEYRTRTRAKPKRKLSAWNKYVKNKRNHITYRDGKLNLKKMAVAFRRKKRR